MTVRILIADDHEVVRKGLRSLLEGEGSLEVVGEASNGREAVSQHKPFFTSRVSELVLAGFLSGDQARPDNENPPGAPLTPREREVLQLLAEGKTNKEVAAALGIGLKTVETHRMNLMAKLGLHSVVDLVRYAIRNGIVAA